MFFLSRSTSERNLDNFLVLIEAECKTGHRSLLPADCDLLSEPSRGPLLNFRRPIAYFFHVSTLAGTLRALSLWLPSSITGWWWRRRHADVPESPPWNLEAQQIMGSNDCATSEGPHGLHGHLLDGIMGHGKSGSEILKIFHVPPANGLKPLDHAHLLGVACAEVCQDLTCGPSRRKQAVWTLIAHTSQGKSPMFLVSFHRSRSTPHKKVRIRCAPTASLNRHSKRRVQSTPRTHHVGLAAGLPRATQGLRPSTSRLASMLRAKPPAMRGVECLVASARLVSVTVAS